MIRIDVHHLLASLTYLAGSHKHLVMIRRQLIENESIGQMEFQRFVEMGECGRRLAAIADGLDMPASRASAGRLLQNLDKVAPFFIALTPNRLSLVADEIAILTSAFQDEMEARLLLAFPASSARYFSTAPLFGELVEDAFPDIAYDMQVPGVGALDAEPDVYSAEALEEIKRLREEEMGRPEKATDAFYTKILLSDLRRIEVTNNSGNVIIDSPGSIIAATVNVKSTRKTVKIQPALGTIGADLKASLYIQYMTSRYNKFASADKSRDTKFSYGAITKNIETNFRGPWRMLAIEDFDALCAYLQQRISRTRIAKANPPVEGGFIVSY